MSFDIFLCSFKADELYYFPRALVEEIFCPHIVPYEGSSLRLLFPDGWGVFIDFPFVEGEDIAGIDVNRPTASPEFWDGILELLRRTPSSLFWPGDGICAVVTNPEVIKELPADFIKGLGVPIVVSTAEEIGECIRRS